MDDATALNGRAICVLRGDDREKLNALADAIVASAKIFDHGGSLVWLHEGQLIRVNADVLREISQTSCGDRAADQPRWQMGARVPSLCPANGEGSRSTAQGGEKGRGQPTCARASGLITCARRTRGRSPLTAAAPPARLGTAVR